MATDIEVGEMVLARESTDTKILDVAEIINVDDSAVQVHCYGTTSKKQLTAKYTPVLTHTDSKKRHHIILWKPRKNQICKKWTWKIRHDDFADLVLKRNVKLDKKNKFDAKTRAKIKVSPHGFRIKCFKRA